MKPGSQLQWVSVTVSGRMLRIWTSCADCLPSLTETLDVYTILEDSLLQSYAQEVAAG
jgi:hypothetical protein